MCGSVALGHSGANPPLEIPCAGFGRSTTLTAGCWLLGVGFLFSPVVLLGMWPATWRAPGSCAPGQSIGSNITWIVIGTENLL